MAKVMNTKAAPTAPNLLLDPQLEGSMRELVRLVPLAGGDPLRLIELSARVQGLWGVCGGDLVRGFCDVPLAPPPDASLWSAILRSLGLRRPAPSAAAQHDELGRALARLHALIAQHVLRYLAALCAPFLSDLRPHLLMVSPKSLAWIIAAATIATGGPAEVPRVRAVLGPRHALVPTDPLGDFLTLHLCVESLVALAGDGLPPAARQRASARRLGGFRTSSFLDAYPRLHHGETVRGDPSWRDAIAHFVQNSPLTLMVYADVIGQPPSPGMDRLFSDLIPAAVLPAPDAPFVERWIEVWFAQCSRSLLAVLLSPPQAWEPLQWGLRRVAELRERLRALAGRGIVRSLRRLRTQQALAAAEEEVRRRRAEVQAQYRQNYRSVADILSRSGTGLGQRYAHIALLDMFVRHMVTVSLDVIRARWRQQRESGPGRMSGNLFGSGGPCFEHVFRVFFGCSPGELPALPTLNDEDRARLQALLEPSIEGVDASRLAREVHIPPELSEPLLARFASSASAGLPLPFPFPDDRASAPQSHLGDFLAAVRNSFGEGGVTTHIETVQVPL